MKKVLAAWNHIGKLSSPPHFYLSKILILVVNSWYLFVKFSGLDYEMSYKCKIFKNINENAIKDKV
jgi:hypothetical protein